MVKKIGCKKGEFFANGKCLKSGKMYPMSMFPKGCKMGEISFQNKCYHKVMVEPKYPIDWAEPTSEKQQGCVMDPAHIVARCIIPSINKENSIGKIFDTIIKESGNRQTQTIKYMPLGKEELEKTKWNQETRKLDTWKETIDKYPETFKIGKATYAVGPVLAVLGEIHSKRYASKKMHGATKTAQGKEFMVTFWQKEPDGPIVIEGNDCLYALAPRIESD
jgi:hypothetical protein